MIIVYSTFKCWLSMKIIMLKLNLTFQQGPVLSPLRESPWQSNDETSKSLEGHSYDNIIIYIFLFLLITFSLAEHWCLNWLCQISDTLRIFQTVRWQRCLTPTQQVNLLKRKNPTFQKRLALFNCIYWCYPLLLSFLDFFLNSAAQDAEGGLHHTHKTTVTLVQSHTFIPS